MAKSKVKKSKKSKKSVPKSPKMTSNSEVSGDEAGVDVKVFPLGHYISDRAEMLEQVFSIIRSAKLKAMLPPVLRQMALSELKSLCLVELVKMSRAQIRAVLAGEPCPPDSEEEEPELPEVIAAAAAALAGSGGGGPLPDSTCAEPYSTVGSAPVSQAAVATAQMRSSNSGRERAGKRGGSLSNSTQRAIHLPTSGTNGTSSGKTPSVMELLELEMRARAIKALIERQDDGAGGNQEGDSTRHDDNRAVVSADEEDAWRTLGRPPIPSQEHSAVSSATQRQLSRNIQQQQHISAAVTQKSRSNGAVSGGHRERCKSSDSARSDRSRRSWSYSRIGSASALAANAALKRAGSSSSRSSDSTRSRRTSADSTASSESRTSSLDSRRDSHSPDCSTCSSRSRRSAAGLKRRQSRKAAAVSTTGDQRTAGATSAVTGAKSQPANARRRPKKRCVVEREEGEVTSDDSGASYDDVSEESDSHTPVASTTSVDAGRPAAATSPAATSQANKHDKMEGGICKEVHEVVPKKDTSNNNDQVYSSALGETEELMDDHHLSDYSLVDDPTGADSTSDSDDGDAVKNVHAAILHQSGENSGTINKVSGDSVSADENNKDNVKQDMNASDSVSDDKIAEHINSEERSGNSSAEKKSSLEHAESDRIKEEAQSESDSCEDKHTVDPSIAGSKPVPSEENERSETEMEGAVPSENAGYIDDSADVIAQGEAAECDSRSGTEIPKQDVETDKLDSSDKKKMARKASARVTRSRGSVDHSVTTVRTTRSGRVLESVGDCAGSPEATQSSSRRSNKTGRNQTQVESCTSASHDVCSGRVTRSAVSCHVALERLDVASSKGINRKKEISAESCQRSSRVRSSRHSSAKPSSPTDHDSSPRNSEKPVTAAATSSPRQARRNYRAAASTTVDSSPEPDDSLPMTRAAVAAAAVAAERDQLERESANKRARRRRFIVDRASDSSSSDLSDTAQESEALRLIRQRRAEMVAAKTACGDQQLEAAGSPTSKCEQTQCPGSSGAGDGDGCAIEASSQTASDFSVLDNEQMLLEKQQRRPSRLDSDHSEDPMDTGDLDEQCAAADLAWSAAIEHRRSRRTAGDCDSSWRRLGEFLRQSFKTSTTTGSASKLSRAIAEDERRVCDLERLLSQCGDNDAASELLFRHKQVVDWLQGECVRSVVHSAASTKFVNVTRMLHTVEQMESRTQPSWLAATSSQEKRTQLASKASRGTVMSSASNLMADPSTDADPGNAGESGCDEDNLWGDIMGE